jgi:hypothetical protein
MHPALATDIGAATHPSRAHHAPLGGVRFAPPLERDAACDALERSGFVVAIVDAIGPHLQGGLSEAVDDAIERALASRGAATRSECCGDAASELDDQIARAREVGARGLAVALGPLRGAAGFSGALEPPDSAVLRLLASAARRRPVVLLLDARDTTTTGYAEPVTLEQLVGVLPLEPALVEPPVAIDPPAPRAAPADESWRAWTSQLVAARGPQPLASLERLFCDSYVPLSNAVGAGLADPHARAAHDDFRKNFVRGYTDAFATFAATTKRPRMVLDVHDIAARIARLHGARSTRLLLVDGMRWDLSRLVEQRVGAKLGPRGAITDEVLLWSALPTTTMRQLETIARGVEALRAPAELDADAEPARGRTAEYVRRLRVGPREIHKLDLVEARLNAARGQVLRALPEIAESTAEIVARHAETLSPHTLLFVFGDHGFTVDRSGAALQGGASPEEVLVGGFAVLVGDVH